MRKVTTIEIPIALINDEVIFTTWMNLYEAILNRPLYCKEEFGSELDLIHDPWWKTKKNMLLLQCIGCFQGMVIHVSQLKELKCLNLLNSLFHTKGNASDFCS